MYTLIAVTVWMTPEPLPLPPWPVGDGTPPLPEVVGTVFGPLEYGPVFPRITPLSHPDAGSQGSESVYR